MALPVYPAGYCCCCCCCCVCCALLPPSALLAAATRAGFTVGAAEATTSEEEEQEEDEEEDEEDVLSLSALSTHAAPGRPLVGNPPPPAVIQLVDSFPIPRTSPPRPSSPPPLPLPPPPTESTPEGSGGSVSKRWVPIACHTPAPAPTSCTPPPPPLPPPPPSELAGARTKWACTTTSSPSMPHPCQDRICCVPKGPCTCPAVLSWYHHRSLAICSSNGGSRRGLTEQGDGERKMDRSCACVGGTHEAKGEAAAAASPEKLRSVPAMPAAVPAAVPLVAVRLPVHRYRVYSGNSPPSYHAAISSPPHGPSHADDASPR